MYKLLISLCVVCCFSCKEKENRKENLQNLLVQKNRVVQSFSVIEKDSAYLTSYQFNKLEQPNGIIVFNYYENDRNNFVVWCDTSKKKYKGVFTKADTVALDLESEKIYSVNGKNFKLLKLVRNKGVTDGEITYFFTADIGLLVSKSNTWRVGQVINPNKDDSDYVRLTALLYRVLTDEDVFKNSMSESKIKFTQPKIE